MATVGYGYLNREAVGFFDALRSYDVERALGHMAEDATYRSPWSNGTLRGKEAIREHLSAWLGDATTRPSLTIRDLRGDANHLFLTVSVSGRFGRAPRIMVLAFLILQGTIRQVVLGDAAASH